MFKLNFFFFFFFFFLKKNFFSFTCPYFCIFQTKWTSDMIQPNRGRGRFTGNSHPIIKVIIRKLTVHCGHTEDLHRRHFSLISHLVVFASLSTFFFGTLFLFHLFQVVFLSKKNKQKKKKQKKKKRAPTPPKKMQKKKKIFFSLF